MVRGMVSRMVKAYGMAARRSLALCAAQEGRQRALPRHLMVACLLIVRQVWSDDNYHNHDDSH